MAKHLIYDLRSTVLPDTIGNKAKNLRRLVHAGFRVPVTLVCSWEAQHQWQRDHEYSMIRLKQELQRWIIPEKLYALRSSANLEDHPDHSFAGQFVSHLNVKGLTLVVNSILDIWEKTQSEQVLAYLERNHIPKQELRMAVLAQEMVEQVISGVAFSRNPVNGSAEVLVEAVHGSGELLVQDGITPMRWVCRGNQWITQPNETSIDQALITDVVNQTKAIAEKTGQNVDLEWVFDGHQVYWVQLREITTLKKLKVYTNRMAKDMLPGIIHPLVWSVNIPIVASGMLDVLTDLIGKHPLNSEDLVKSFYYHTYFQMEPLASIFRFIGLPEQTIEMMMGLESEPRKMPPIKPNMRILRLLPHVIRFIWEKAHMVRYFDQQLPVLATEFMSLGNESLETKNDIDLIARIERLSVLVRQSAYLNTISQLLDSLHILILRRQLTNKGIDFEQVDLTAGRTDIQDSTPTVKLAHLYELYSNLPYVERQSIQEHGYTAVLQRLESDPFRQAFAAFLEQFGHLTDSSNDFTVAPWREQPDLVLRMVAQQPANAIHIGKDKLRFEDIRLPAANKWMLARIYRRMLKYQRYRECIGTQYIRGYGLFRGYFLELGKRFVHRQLLITPEDIFLLNLNEVKQLVVESSPTIDSLVLARERREDMERSRSVTLPQVIYGDAPVPLCLAANQKLIGTPTSKGMYSGRVVVVRGLSDFEKVVPGSVVVVPYSDVGWTPLFTRAGAVVAESGGILSHSSIIAREYGIPAVVAVENATQLAENCLVTVDGYRGEVIIH